MHAKVQNSIRIFAAGLILVNIVINQSIYACPCVEMHSYFSYVKFIYLCINVLMYIHFHG